MRIMMTAVLALVLSGAAARALPAQLATKKTLTLEAAKTMVAAAEAEARRNNWNLVIAVVDDGGHLLLLERMDGVQLASIQIAISKARTAALYRRATKDFADRMTAGNNNPLALPDMMPLEGGLPIILDGQVIGAIAASGAASAQDAQAAQKGIEALR